MDNNSVPFESQVGGHPGLRTSADGSQIIKPCLHSERLFYETVINGHQEGFRLLSKHVPNFLGVTADAEGKGLVLENVSNAFKKPNILDIKLGTVLYDDSATEEKKQRMIKAAKETTSLETGVRITGFQVYDATTDTLIHTPKPYGRALTVARLPEATARFFPIRTPIFALSSHLPPKKENPDNLGHHPQKDIADSTTNEEEDVDITPSPAGTRPDLLLPVLKGIVAAVKNLSEAVAKTEMRMVAGSVLIIYEGDELALESALNNQSSLEEQQQGTETETVPASATITGARTTITQNSSVTKGVKVPPAYAVKLIDFAHTKLQDGLGPDEGALFGLRTVISLLEGRIKEVQEAIGSSEDVS